MHEKSVPKFAAKPQQASEARWKLLPILKSYDNVGVN